MLRKILLYSGILFTAPLLSQQQLIVDPSGQGEYTTIQSAFESLNGSTITSDVEVLIRPGEYDEELFLSNIDNSATGYTVTIRSESGDAGNVILLNSNILSLNERILVIEGTSHVRVEHLTFKTSSGNSEAFIKLANGITDISFQHNVFLNETSNSAYAIYDNYDFFGESDTVTNIRIEDNHFSDVHAFFSYFQAFKDFHFKNNLMEKLVSGNSGGQNFWYHINGLTITGNMFSGISVGYFTNCQDIVINRNRIISENGGMTLSSDYSKGHSTYKIFNNFFVVEKFGVNILLAGLEVEIANNNFYVTGSGTASSIQINTYYVSEITSHIKAVNNNFYAEGPGAFGVFITNDPDSIEMATLEFDYNNYFSSEENHHWLVFSGAYTDLSLEDMQSAYGFETNGLSMDPLYQSPQDLHIGNVGLKNRGVELDYITVDIDGEQREGKPDIGADELRGFVNLVPDDSLQVIGTFMGGKNIQLKYRVENRGNLTLGGEWTDAVYLSEDGELDESDLKLAMPGRNFLLNAGESYLGDVSIKLPIDIPGGTYYFLLNINDEEKEFDRDLSDNIAVSDPVLFLDPLYPDLKVTETVTPPTQFSGKSFELEWTVTNTGTGPTTGTWQDYIFIANQEVSLDDPSILQSDSLFLKRVVNPVALNPGESYQQRTTVSIPLRYSGKLFYRIQTNGSASITELDTTFAGNGLTSAVVNITQSPLPDLSVTQLGTPATAFSGEKVPVNWTVENVGQQGTYRTSIQLNDRNWLHRSNYNYWYDHVYISKKPWYDPEEPTQRVAVRYDRGDDELDAGASYTINDSIEFLSCDYGLYYVFVRTNDDRYTYELSFQNNINLLDSIELIIDPQPDLVPTDLKFSGTPLSGRTLEVSYTVENSGFSDITESRVMDYFYISKLDSLTEKQSTFLGFEAVTDQIAQDAAYTRTINIELPFEEFGDYYLFIKTDGEDNICEVQGEDNNVLGIPIKIELSDQPDLIPTLSGLPDTLVAGNSYPLSITVSNEGEADAVQDLWYDEIRLGQRSLYKEKYTNLLPSGESYTRTASISIQLDQQEGEYPLVLVTDANDNLFEYGGEDNNVIIKDIYISQDPEKVADLVLETVDISNEGLTAGDMLMLDYAVRNTSAVGTSRNGWTDQLHLIDSEGAVVWSKDLNHFGHIASGSLFTGTHQVHLPYTLSGNYTIELTVNSRRTLVEYVTENNSASASAVIGAYIPPDLEVKEVRYTSCCQLFALQEDSLVITIMNNGPGDLDDKQFTLKVLLAEDMAGSNGNTLIAHRQEYTIPGGGMVSIIVPVKFNAHLSGDYFTIVELDTEKEIYEGKATANNRFVTGYTVNIDNEPIPFFPVELTINSATEPEFSQFLSVTYRVEKGTEKILQRYIEDQIILSSDRHFDKDDYRFRFAPEYRNIPAETATYEGDLFASLPSYLQPGWYFVGVKVDAGNNVVELDETNNVLFTADSFYLDFTVPLELDQPVSLSFYEGTVGSQEAFSLTRPAGKGIIATVDFSDDQASSELYHREATMPTRATFDNRYRNPFMADQEVIVPVTDSDTKDYLRLYANRVPWVNNSPLDFECWANYVVLGGGNVFPRWDPECHLPDPVPYTITAQSAEFSILRSTPDSASYLGVSNLLIEGFDFEENMQFYLVNGTDSIQARRVEILSSTEAVGVFDLREKAAGTYDMVAIKQTGETTVNEDYFNVFLGHTAIPWASVNHALRAQLTSKKLYVNVDYGNYSHVNGYDYWLIVAFATKSGSLDDFSSTYIGSSVEDYYDQLEFNPNPTADSNYVDIEGMRFYAYWLPVLPPRSQTTFSYILESSAEDLVLTQAYIIEQPLSRFKFSADIEHIGQSVTVAKLLDGLFNKNLSQTLSAPLNNGKKSVMKSSAKSSFDCSDLNIRDVELEIAKDVKGVAEHIHGGAKSYKGASNLVEASEMAIKNKKKALTDAVEGAVDVRGNATASVKAIAKDEVRSMLLREKSGYEKASDYAEKVFNDINPWNNLQESLKPEKLPFEDLINNTFSCIDAGSVEKRVQECYTSVRHNDPNGGTYYTYSPVTSENCFPPEDDGGGGGGGGGSFITRFVNSLDPNAIIGPEGVTDARMVNRDAVMQYTIQFENKSEASAPARFVSINNELPDGLRSQSFVLTEFGFGDTIVRLEPTNRLNYRMELGKIYNYQQLNLVAGIDIVNNRAFWRFSTIDPETGNLTTDPFNGFLPPNDSTGIGDGFVTYEIRIDRSVEGGTEISNQADIIFDQNEVIPTNVWSNVVAGSNPVSRVNELPEISDSVFTVMWEGTPGDLSAGIREYDIYVSTDNEPYEPLVESTLSTSISFTGVPGSVYRFYSVLTTIDGIREPAPSQPDAMTGIRIATDTSGTDTTQVGMDIMPETPGGSDFHSRVYPNPAADRMWIEYASDSEVLLTLFDLSGRILHNEMLEQSARVRQVPLELGEIPGGVLILQLDNRENRKIFKIVKTEQ